jgi:hypothetical protein
VDPWPGRWAPSRRCARHDFPGRGRYRDSATAPRITAGSLLVALPVLACTTDPCTKAGRTRINHRLMTRHHTSACLGRSRVSAGQFRHGDEEQELSLFIVHEQRPLGGPANAIADGLLAEDAERKGVSDLLDEIVAADGFHAVSVAACKRFRDALSINKCHDAVPRPCPIRARCTGQYRPTADEQGCCAEHYVRYELQERPYRDRFNAIPKLTVDLVRSTTPLQRSATVPARRHAFDLRPAAHAGRPHHLAGCF